MAWKLYEANQRQGWNIGEIKIKTIKNSFASPKRLIDKGFNWYLEDKEGIVKLILEEKSIHKIKNSISFPKSLKNAFGDDKAICYQDEDAIYFATYKVGQKKLVAFLRQQKVMQ